MPDVTTLMEQDHRELEGYFAQFKSSQDPKVAQTICEELDVHAAAEEQAVYPRFAEESAAGLRQGGREGARRGAPDRRPDQEHDQSGAPRGAGREARGAVSHHVHEEETEMFPRLARFSTHRSSSSSAKRSRPPRRAEGQRECRPVGRPGRTAPRSARVARRQEAPAASRRRCAAPATARQPNAVTPRNATAMTVKMPKYGRSVNVPQQRRDEQAAEPGDRQSRPDPVGSR